MLQYWQQGKIAEMDKRIINKISFSKDNIKFWCISCEISLKKT